MAAGDLHIRHAFAALLKKRQENDVSIRRDLTGRGCPAV